MKKTIITFMVLLSAVSSDGQTIGRKVISTAGGTLTGGGYSISYNIGETMTATLSAGSNIITQGFEQPDDALLNSLIAALNLKAFLEGYYTNFNTMQSTVFDLGISNDPTVTDTITVNLWSAGNLASITPDYSLRAVLHTNGTATVQFPAAVRGHSYYIAVKHRNHIETWSHNLVTFIADTGYDFSTGLNQAYDDGVNPPMKFMGNNVYAFYAGDVTQDGSIDASDIVSIDNDNSQFAFGYNDTDITGDGATDASDLVVIDNNSQLFLFFARPY